MFLNIKLALVITIIFVAIVLYVWMEVNVPAVRKVHISLTDFPEEIKIVHITDAHGLGVPNDGRLMRAIRSFAPDVIALTGDMIDEATTDFTPVLTAVTDLSAIAPVLFVPGNHERANPKGGAFIRSLSSAGANVLLNDAVLINGLSVCGVDDVNFSLHDVPSALAVYGRCDILLSHSPEIHKSINELNIPLVLAGHTHGGQIRLPILGAIFMPGGNIPEHLMRGITKDGDTTFYVSVGLGTRLVPIRFMSRAEIALITVIPK